MPDDSAREGQAQPTTWAGSDAGLPPPPGFFSGVPGDAPLAPPGRAPRGRKGRGALIVAAVLMANSLLGAWFLAKVRSDPASRTSGGAAQVEGDKSARAIAGIVDPAVVDINTYGHDFGTAAGSLAPLGSGTGMILTSTGQVLTNNHVVEGASKIEVTISGRPGTVVATVVGVDPTADVALLQLQGVSGLPTITPADAASVTVGERVLGIGNALGRGGTPAVVAGSISAVGRTITAGNPGGSSEKLTGMLETNAQIQPGDSGGPLVDTSGHVVGMITAGNANERGGAGPVTTGFAIPADTALGIVDRIRAGESSTTILLGDRGHMGIAVRALDARTARRLRVSSGALVVGVDPQGPAAAVGITAPAIIQSVSGQTVTSADALGPILHAYVPGEKVTVTWVDANGVHTSTVVLGTGPAV